jgi:hypothetical protein
MSGGECVPPKRSWRDTCSLRGIGGRIACAAIAVGGDADKRRVRDEI